MHHMPLLSAPIICVIPDLCAGLHWLACISMSKDLNLKLKEEFFSCEVNYTA